MKRALVFLFIAFNIAAKSQTCSALFSFGSNFETVTFYNQSSISNAHYFWNFGDGTGSYYKDPTHKFPETGTYLVSLYAKDTISNCSNYYEFWLNVTKYSTDPCKSGITDSVFTYGGIDLFTLIDQSTNCNGYHKEMDGGPALNFQIGNWIYLGGYWQTIPFRMVTRVKYYDNTWSLKRVAYKSSLHKYINNKHYNPCSANFEFTVVSEDTSYQRILFTAMNKQATTYDWIIAGFGNPIHSSYDTLSQLFPQKSTDLWQVGLCTVGQSGCRDTLWQNIRIQDSASVYTVQKIEELKGISTKINIFPNPVITTLHIEYENQASANSEIEITNTLGQTVLKLPYSSSIDVSVLPQGFYGLKITDQNRQAYFSKFVKE